MLASCLGQNCVQIDQVVIPEEVLDEHPDIPVDELLPDVETNDDTIAYEGDLVVLEATTKSKANIKDYNVSFLWTQDSGVPVELHDSTSLSCYFIAPEVDEDVTLTFTFTAWNSKRDVSVTTHVQVYNLVDVAGGNLTADAGADSSVTEGDTVTLDGSNSTGDGDLIFSWTQISGELAILSADDKAITTFIAPLLDTEDPQTLVFELTVTDGTEVASDLVSIIVNKDSTNNDGGGGGGGGDDPCPTPDSDADGDGVSDCTDGCPTDPNKIEAGVCGCGIADTDTDEDGIADCNDGCPNDSGKTEPGACGCGMADVDSDGDGIVDCDDPCPDDPENTCGDLCPDDPAKITPGICGCGTPDSDSDGDGTPDCNESCPNDPSKTEPGVCGCGVADVDTDADGTLDCNDTCPNDSSKIDPGLCGCGVADTDRDGDGIVDCQDTCPDDAHKSKPGICGCGTADIDSDNDGTADCNDECPDDPYKNEPGACGCGNTDRDSDGDGVLDCNDSCPNNAAKTEPGQCGCDVADTDRDGDGTSDCNDACPDDSDKFEPGQCGCGVSDTDSDGDGTADCNDACPDDPEKLDPGQCGCGVVDTDSDGDGTADCNDSYPDDPYKIEPGDCGCGAADIDSDGDGVSDCVGYDQCPTDSDKTEPGQCGCGVADTDSDADGIADCNDGCPDDANKLEPGQCGCGIADTDGDADGVADCNDNCPTDSDKLEPGQCGCGIADTDSDSDGVADCNDNCPNDSDKIEPGQCGCGIPNTDSDSDGVADCNDSCPSDPNKREPGLCGCGNADVDSDSDGTVDCNDSCPNDANKIEPGTCGCGVADTDSDGDGLPDCIHVGGLIETLDGYTAGDDPSDWLDTDANNSLSENDSLFKVFDLSGEKVFGTSSTATNIHSHYVGAGSADWTSYTYTGRVMITAPDGGIGLTFRSDYPHSDKYYRLRRYNSGAFHIEPHGTSVTGTVNSGVFPSINTWYQFKIEVEDTGAQTTIRAKVWAQGSSEPANWQIDCYDASAGRLTSGTIGIWSMGSGEKYWDDLNVTSLNLNCDSDSDGDGVSDCSDQCPSDPAKIATGVCGCGTPDTDSDGDAVPDCNDVCPGQPDVDSDGDGVVDCEDVCPGSDDHIDSDGDGTPDGCEPASLCASQSTLDLGCSSTSTTFDVWNCGTGILHYEITDNAGWLSLSSTSGNSAGEHDTITANVNRAGLANGDYTAEITVSSNVGAPILILVTLTVGCPDSQTMYSASRTSGVAPLAVFFDAAAPASQVVQPAGGKYAFQQYAWDFDDPASGTWSTNGISKNGATGYVSAHVFENPGTYTILLDVADTHGVVHAYQQTITVSAFSGTTYYVSSSGGSDSNNGLSTATPFRTIGRGLGSLSSGKRLLLKRGDTFSTSSSINLPSGSTLGAYGSGSVPVLQATTPDSDPAFKLHGKSVVNVMDLRIAGTTQSGPTFGTYDADNILLLRVTSVGGISSGVFYGDHIFMVDSNALDAWNMTLFTHCSHLALLGNTIDKALASHNIYGDVVDRGVISSNRISRPSYNSHNGRHNLRIAANHGLSPCVVITDNDISGGDNSGYQTWLSVHFAITSGNWDTGQHAENILFERNTVRNAGTLIQLQGDYRNTTIRNNNLQGGFAFKITPHPDVPDNVDGPTGVWFHDNTITNGGGGWYSFSAPMDYHQNYVYDNAVNGTVVQGNSP